MSDEKQNAEKVKDPFSKPDGTPFTGFAKPYLDFIDNGKYLS